MEQLINCPHQLHFGKIKVLYNTVNCLWSSIGICKHLNNFVVLMKTTITNLQLFP